MMLLKMAFRNVLRNRRRSLLTGLMVLGGFTLCSVSLGFSDGSYGSIIDLFTRDHTGHVQMHKGDYLDRPSLYKTMDLEKLPMDEIQSMKHVVSLSPRILSGSLAFKESKTTGAQVVGINPAKEAATTRVAQQVARGRYLSQEPANEVVIGEGLSKILDAGLGDDIAVITQGADGSMATDMFTVVGITGEKSGSYYKMKCFMHIKTAEEFLSLGLEEGKTRVHEIAILLDDQKNARKTAKAISGLISGDDIDVEPWQVVEKQFYRAMQVDNKGNYISQAVIMLMVAVGVLNTVLMSILERTREFGVLRAVGTRPVKVFFLIVMETAILSLMGIAGGIVVSTIANHYLSIHGISLSTTVEYGGIEFKTMLSTVSARTIWVPGVVTLFAATLVSIFPGIRAARIQPVKAMSSM